MRHLHLKVGRVLIAYIDGLTATEMVDQDVVQRLLGTKLPPEKWDQGALTPVHLTRATQWPDILDKLASGNTLLFAENTPFVWVVDTVQYTARSITRPQTELAVRGSEEAFTELLFTKKSQIRRNVRSAALRFWDVTVGHLQPVTVTLVSLEGLTNPALVTTAQQRLQAVQVDGLTTMTQLTGLIRDHPHSIFPTLRQTERLDFALWRLMQGAIVIMMDGDPFVAIAPAPLADFYRTAMDYSSSWPDTSFVRFIRFLGWLLGLYLPALYLALTEVNVNVLPSRLFILTQGSSAGLPFSPFVQVILMVLMIETLREAALRLPKSLSTTISIIGAIVLGTAITKSGFVDPQILVIMTLTALSLFSTPVYELAATWRIVGWILVGSSLFLGLLGLVLCTMVFMGILIDMQSFGVPYFTPWAPFRGRDWGDVLWRMPWTMRTTRWEDARPAPRRWRIPGRSIRRPHLRKARRFTP